LYPFSAVAEKGILLMASYWDGLRPSQ